MQLEQQLKTFVDLAVNYFGTVTREAAEVQPPQIDFGGLDLQDYTGVVSISGVAHGWICLTAPTAMLNSLLDAIGEMEKGPAYLADLVGEMTNTISSNARKEWGADFQVSVPQVVRKGEPLPWVDLPVAFVLPISWRGFSCQLVIAIEEPGTAALVS